MYLTMWICLIVIAVLIDLITTNVMFSWLTFGFIAAIIANIQGYDLTFQILLASIIGIISFAIGSYLSRKYIKKNINNTPILTDKIIGTIVTADKFIDESAQHKVNGIYWTVVNEGVEIKPGENFKVDEIRNNKLYIIKVS